MALALGKTVLELEKSLSSYELTEWIAFYSLEPFGDERADLRTGIVASTMANINRGKKQKPFSPLDFMMFTEHEEPEKEQAESDQVKELIYSLGLKVIDKRKA